MPKPEGGPYPNRMKNQIDDPSVLGVKELTPEELNPDVPQKVTQELKDLGRTILKEMYYVGAQLKHGIPLKGSCSCCPGKEISIKD